MPGRVTNFDRQTSKKLEIKFETLGFMKQKSQAPSGGWLGWVVSLKLVRNTIICKGFPEMQRHCQIQKGLAL